MRIIGIEEKTGEFNDKPYHNVYFHCAEEFANEKGKGLNVSIAKVKYDILTDIFEKALTTTEIFSLVGNDVEFYYDRFRRVKKLDIFESNQPTKK